MKRKTDKKFLKIVTFVMIFMIGGILNEKGHCSKCSCKRYLLESHQAMWIIYDSEKKQFIKSPKNEFIGYLTQNLCSNALKRKDIYPSCYK
ncbi:MAG: hypothetical protein ACD_16C00205G0024 [uncultured bacterium]|nr:MAG: hypothetical protein ACD_16C00205G0024 [uncultured bacterium]OFW73267.1 MAG: hypothetical protein A2Z80_03780 [Alphaproteobacteria bacterium GWA2_41_27]OFW91455.1 MAG: hypothetical protein A2W46_04415 [Alphaproteobacteria bacterium RIFCSPHIGHO2_12_42_13]OFX05376.1 MAG: hypothetical protein A3H46_04705 [Alphaproteobacteria bacterium RIFCSPLOWO2_02_FULL_43_54]OFX07676.1 MAG: hypothetical protein A3G78_07145 [Alphaproteobacteria bacterium RIFCSPLOWO2_12_FULL_42_29]HBW24886.1 hypothetical 